MVGYIDTTFLHNTLDESIHSRTSKTNIVRNVNKEELTTPANTLASVYRARVMEAYRNRRIFTIYGNYNTLRKSLQRRGWLEKLPLDRFSKLQKLSEAVLLTHTKRGNEYETVLISKIISHLPAFFVWQPKEHRDLYSDVFPYRNRLRISNHMDFSTKVGFIACSEQHHWYRENDKVGIIHPRFFRLGANQEDRLAFIEEFHITQCYSLLRYLVQHLDKHEEVVDYQRGTINVAIVQFALARVKQKLNDCENCGVLDIEKSQIPAEEWEKFLQHSSEVINGTKKFKITYRELTDLIKTSKSYLTKIQQKYPDLKWDGYKNLWILKPGYLNRGRGIIILNNLDEILRWGTSHSNNHYIVQKYIERPLLIYGTKFDIRQFMLICVREATVQIWLYAECYFRFSTQEYCTDVLDEAIHLTNNCVQRKYKNSTNRDLRLPRNNMWTLDQFRNYLKTQNLSDNFWENHIFAGFRANLIAILLPSLDEANLSENSFELYGCDFMLDEEYNPILIEINATPDLCPSTEITARICPMMLQDCVKVVVDLPRNSRASTGLFKMIYEVNYKFNQDNDKEELSICGKSFGMCKSARIQNRLKSIKSSKTGKKHIYKITSEKKASELSTGIRKTRDVSKILNAATKEALALRYTMPK